MGGDSDKGLPLGLWSLLIPLPDLGSFLEASFPGSPQLSPSPQGPQLKSSPYPCPQLLLSVCLCPSLPISDPLSFCFLPFCSLKSPFFLPSLGLSLCIPSPSVVPRKLPEPDQDSRLTPLKHLPSIPLLSLLPQRPPSLTLGSHAPPAAQRPAPGQQDPAHPRGTTQSMPNFPQKLLGTPWGRGQGRVVPGPPPSSGLPGFGTARLAQRSGGRPHPALLSGAFPAPLPPSLPPRFRATLSPPLAPPASAHGGSPRGHPDFKGLTRREEDQLCLKGALEGG